MTTVTSTIDALLVERMRSRLALLYGERADDCLARVLELLKRYAPAIPSPQAHGWDERDIVLITYADQIRQPGQTPLSTLQEFLTQSGLHDVIRVLHLLPFFPSSSDDGFSVIDYRTVDPALGTWDDIRALRRHFDLMFDLVLNHASRASCWFEGYLAGREPYVRYFIEADPAQDLSRVTRPRSLPLLTPVETSRGVRHLWTTFSDDQIDLNYAEPDLLIEMIEVLLFYVQRGARMIRLDAVAYLWKRLGTACIHLPETHVVVKLLRDVVEALAPGTLLLTETNVPHAENVSYLGAGDEAQLVYQFSLAPLLLDAFLNEDAGPLSEWLGGVGNLPPGTSYVNFTASHDGLGLRPLEGLLPPERIARLVEAARTRGGLVSMRRAADGTESPYELNITYFDALGGPGLDAALHARRFLASQALMLALRGIPAVYFHSLVGTPNDHAGVAATGRARSINRRKFHREELEAMIAKPGSAQATVFQQYRRMLAVRRSQRAFHPDAAQEVWRFEEPGVAGFLRTSADPGQHILAAANLSGSTQTVELPARPDVEFRLDLLSGQAPCQGRRLVLAPYQAVWLEGCSR